jgi:hypothetical protein
MEGVSKGKNHVVDRWNPSGDRYAELCQIMLELAGMRIGDEPEGPRPGAVGQDKPNGEFR